MRGTVAKRLRRYAESETIGLTKQETKKWYKDRKREYKLRKG